MTLTRSAEGPWSNLALHTIGWKAFQDLCSQICEVVLERPIEIFREAKDGGQDAIFLIAPKEGTTSAIGSVQCKHTSDMTRQLRLSDLTAELDHISSLVQAGQAETYVLMTNMSLAASVAFEIRRKILSLGVGKAHILGRQYLVRAIKSSPRLRALVPQVYGLGDLTSIMDERLSQQSKALIEHWIPKLKSYVPTRAHRSAVRALSDHGIVLLLGNPSSGKSAIGAILSTIASEDPHHTVLVLTSPKDFEEGWNPNDPGRFFWIDDAFGSNVLRDDFVQDWTSAFRKVQAAIAHGNKFLLTSRKHIYEAAHRRLGQKNLPEFIDGRAKVDVGTLTLEEKEQILYNHINFGNQSQSWKTRVKPHLDAVAGVDDFLPGIAERLGDPTFTKSLTPQKSTLVQFMKEPRQHLIDTVNALDSVHFAGLLLIYVHQGSFINSPVIDPASQAVAELTTIPLPRILERLGELKGSFLKVSTGEYAPTWSFAHPTFADAMSEILREKPHMMAALIRGATIDTVLRSFVCEGTPTIRDALAIPASLNDLLVGRLLQTPDEIERNWSLFWFLAERSNDNVFGSVLRADPSFLTRKSWGSLRAVSNPRILTHARAHRLGLLDEELREKTASELEDAVKWSLDLSYFEDADILSLIPSSRLVALGMSLRAKILPNAHDHISQLADEANLDEDPESHFELVEEALTVVESLYSTDDKTIELIEALRGDIATQIDSLAVRKAERDEEGDNTSDWSQFSAISRQIGDHPFKETVAMARSVFDDVDE